LFDSPRNLVILTFAGESGKMAAKIFLKTHMRMWLQSIHFQYIDIFI